MSYHREDIRSVLQQLQKSRGAPCDRLTNPPGAPASAAISWTYERPPSNERVLPPCPFRRLEQSDSHHKVRPEPLHQ